MASGALLCRFGAAAAQQPASGGATPDLRVEMLVLDFDAAAGELTRFVDVMPPSYSGGGLTVRLRWMASTATSGAVQWLVYFQRHQRGVDDQDTDGWGTVNTPVATAAVAPCGTEMETLVVVPTGATMDNIAVGDRFRLQITRDAAAAADTMAGDAELVTVDVLET